MSLPLAKFVCFSLCLTTVAASLNWLSKEVSSQEVWTRPMCTMRKFHFTAKQRGVCRNNLKLMIYVSESATQAKEQCMSNFLNTKWNCNSIDQAPYFGHDLTNGTREAAVVHAMSAASLAHIISSKCATGAIANCACQGAILHGRIQFFQQKCPSIIKKGVHFAKQFIAPGSKKIEKVKAKSAKKALLMDLENHNRHVGFKLLHHMKSTKCTCRGATGQCQVKTCYNTLPKFEEVAKELKKRYDEASLVYPDTKAGSFVPAANRNDVVSGEELIYTEKSLNNCGKRKGRYCSLEPGAENNCKTFCCGGKHEERQIISESQCDCQFEWCCKLKCQTCYTYPKRNFCV